MHDENILDMISEEIAELTPDNFNQIKERCKNEKNEAIINAAQKNKSNSTFKAIISAVAVFAIVFCSLFGITAVNSKVDCVIGIDVNPSIQIETNKKSKVLSVKPLNSDAVMIINDMDFKGTDLKIAVNALIGSMLRNGFITETQNSVLVSVESKNTKRQELIIKEMTDDICGVLSESNISAAVLTQSLNGIADTITELASFYGISEGKAALISEICQNSDKCDFASLAGLPVSELMIIAQSKKNVSDNICVSGKTNNDSYISIGQAKETALDDCNVSESEVSMLDVELECDNGVLVYEVSFRCGNYNYEYEIDTYGGDIVGKKKEYIYAPTSSPAEQTADDLPSQSATQENQSDLYIDSERAKNIALSHAGISESDIKNYKSKLDTERGVVIYEIEFDSGNYEYEYDINAFTGKVFSYNKEKNSDCADSTTAAPSSEQSFIGESKAKEIAFSHACVSESEATNIKVKLEQGITVSIYEIEFDAGGYEYEYEINAVTGKVRRFDSEHDDNYIITSSTTVSTTSQSVLITEAEAKLIALKHSGIDENSIRAFESDLKNKKDRYIYEVEFKSNNYEYEYEIDASSGKIISYEKETDD